MITLGINAAFHDSAAAVVIDGKVVAASEEERYTRIKHGKRPLPFTAWELPFNAIDDCLRQAGITLADVDHVAYSYNPERFLRSHGGMDGAALCLPPAPAMRNGRPVEAAAATVVGRWDNPWDPLFVAYIQHAAGQLADGAPHHLKARFTAAKTQGHYRFHHVDHHLCHQASAFLAAPFDHCAVMTLDGRGEDATTSYGVYQGGTYRALGEVCMPHSLGLLYEQVTTHLGFLHSSDEYKVMALAAMGEPTFADGLAAHVRVGDDGHYTISPIDLPALVGPARERGSELTQRDFNLAASLQQVLERSVLKIARWLRQATGERQVAMAGGVALNCVMNSVLRDAGIFDAVWVQPAAGDAGTALGAALWVDACQGEPPRETLPQRAVHHVAKHWQMDHAYLGPGESDAEIEAFLSWAKLPYRRLHDLAGATARLLADGKVIGWVQGRMEFGPRALGGRSIIASPIDPAMQARINELKDREDFRPVAPAVPEERLAEWFTPAGANDGKAPFMLFIYDVLSEQAARIPSACHSDLTARVQTVSSQSNPRFHALLDAFGALTGVPVLINTSFNVRGEPVVCTAKDAVNAFYSTPIDALVIGSFLLEKS